MSALLPTPRLPLADIAVLPRGLARVGDPRTDRATLVRSRDRLIPASGLAAAVAQASVDPTLDDCALQDALRAAIDPLLEDAGAQRATEA